jgi:hypothetical protein
MGMFGVIGTYAPPTSPADSTVFWRELFQFLDNHFAWIILGDFNMAEVKEDQLGGNPKDLRGPEYRDFSHLKRKMRWEDTLKRIPGRISYTWDNKQIFTVVSVGTA